MTPYLSQMGPFRNFRDERKFCLIFTFSHIFWPFFLMFPHVSVVDIKSKIMRVVIDFREPPNCPQTSQKPLTSSEWEWSQCFTKVWRTELQRYSHACGYFCPPCTITLTIYELVAPGRPLIRALRPMLPGCRASSPTNCPLTSLKPLASLNENGRKSAQKYAL